MQLLHFLNIVISFTRLSNIWINSWKWVAHGSNVSFN
jgi:hypothetical protein